MVRSRRDAIAEARRLGITVETVRRTGEVRFTSPDGGPTVRLNNRRDDSTRAVEAMLRRHTPQPERKERTDVTATTPKPKGTPAEAARVFVKTRTTEEVIRLMAAEPKADPRLVALVERFDRRAARRASGEAAS